MRQLNSDVKGIIKANRDIRINAILKKIYHHLHEILQGNVLARKLSITFDSFEEIYNNTQ